MPPIIVKVAAIRNIIGVRIINEVLDFLTLLLFIFGLVLVFNLGLDIEEGSAVVLAPLAAMALRNVSVFS